MNKCPNCGSENFLPVKPPTGTSYVLTTVDQSTDPATFKATSGSPVDLYGCLDCKFVSLHMPDLQRE
ncbi:MAG: hypothetical protein ACFWT6_11865 [Virgibacillus proomii]|jgi:DNA-directed RNA polymerase subunit RPC12/RpoP